MQKQRKANVKKKKKKKIFGKGGCMQRVKRYFQP